MNNLLILFLLLSSSIAFLNSKDDDAKKDIRLEFSFKNTPIDYSATEILPVYRITFDSIKVFKDYLGQEYNKYKIKLPENVKLEDTGFVYLFFTGDSNSVLSRISMCIVSNYTTDSVLFWVDENNNLDFNDDSPPFAITKNNIIQRVVHRNSSFQDGIYITEISRFSTNDAEERKATREYFFNDDPEKGYLTSEIDYWFQSIRKNVRTCQTMIEGEPIQLGLMDWNCNGLYNDIDTILPDNHGCDRILVGKYYDTVLSINPSDGASAIVKNTFIPINGKKYLLKEADRFGKYIIISKTDSVSRILQSGDIIPDFSFPNNNWEKTNLYSELIPGKYNLIDIWGFWCKPCLNSITELKELDSLYKDKLNIIGFHDNNSNTRMAIDAIKKYNVKWSKGFLTQEITEKLMSGGQFPYYVLIDGNKKIIKLNCKLSEVREILNK